MLARDHGKTAIRMQLQIGTINVQADPGDGIQGNAEMEQAVPTFETPANTDASTLAGLLGLEAAADLAPETPPEFGTAGNPFLYIRLRSLDAVRRARGAADALERCFAGHHHPAVFAFCTGGEAPEAAARASVQSGSGRGCPRGSRPPVARPDLAGGYLSVTGLIGPGRLLLEQGYEMLRPSQIKRSGWLERQTAR